MIHSLGHERTFVLPIISFGGRCREGRVWGQLSRSGDGGGGKGEAVVEGDLAVESPVEDW